MFDKILPSRIYTCSKISTNIASIYPSYVTNVRITNHLIQFLRFCNHRVDEKTLDLPMQTNFQLSYQ